jgi:uncharacterized repeat protein (TIGR03803 family)
MPRRIVLACVFGLACAALSGAGQAPVYRLLYSGSLSQTTNRPMTIAEVEPGLFYFLGSAGTISISSVTSTGKNHLIYSFPPYTLALAMVQAANGKLYGNVGLRQTVPYFSLTPTGRDYQQYLSPPPWGNGFELIVTPPGPLYDIAAWNPTSNTRVYGFLRLEESGAITILYQFSATDVPAGTNLTLGADGNIYSVGAQPSGVTLVQPFIFRLTPGGSYSRLANLDPAFPRSIEAIPLMAASDGNLYGTFGEGGANNEGEIYQATLSGQVQTVASFAKPMINPETLMQGADGNIYGSTLDNFIFRYNLATHALNSIYHLNDTDVQGKCPCYMVEGMDGKLYASAPLGGPYPGYGVVFSLDIGLPKPVPLVSGLYPASGAVGQRVLLWGNWLLGATSVTFNGVPASAVSVTSVQTVYATVPAGATTGPVTITTANGSYTTTQSFTVQ